MRFEPSNALRGLLPNALRGAVWWRASVYFGLLCAIVGLPYASSEVLNYRAAVKAARKVVESDVDIAAQRLLYQLADYSHRLSLAVRLEASSDPERLVEYYRALVEETPALYQLRHLDSTGRETLRLDLIDGKAHHIPQERLQDKASRPYFPAAVGLRAHEVYASPLNLNMERGRIEVPWRPTLRLASRLGPGASASFVVANFDASPLLEPFTFSNQGNSASAQRTILNGQGYWLAGVAKNKLWGFMFPHRANLAADDPALWRQLTARPEQPWQRGEIMYAVRFLEVGRALQPGDSARMQLKTNEHWWLVSERHVPAPFTMSRTEKALGVLILLVGAILCGFVSQTVVARQQAEADSALAQRQLQRTERLASLGGLVAGVSHELNTPIGNAVTIVSAMEAQQRAVERAIEGGRVKKADVASFVQEAGRGCAFALRNLARASELIGRFKGIAVDQSSERRRDFQLDAYLDELAATLRPIFKHSQVRFVVQAKSGAQLDSFPGAIAQIVINLVNNAQLHGFEPDRSGTITLSAQRKNDIVVIGVEDDGVGIPQRTRGRVFDPFYTTRMGEGGSGLGLSISQNLARDVLGGSLELCPQTEGTRFELRIPVLAPATCTASDAHEVQKIA